MNMRVGVVRVETFAKPPVDRTFAWIGLARRAHQRWVLQRFPRPCRFFGNMVTKETSFASHSIYPLTLLYDGKCESIRHEITGLRSADGEQRLIFVDVSEPRFDLEYCGEPITGLREKIHAVRPDGRVLKGRGVLHVAYAAVGRGWMFARLGWHITRPVTELVYWLISQHRYLLRRKARPWLTMIKLPPAGPKPMAEPFVKNPHVDATLALLSPMPVLSDEVGGLAEPPRPIRSEGWHDTLPLVNTPSQPLQDPSR